MIKLYDGKIPVEDQDLTLFAGTLPVELPACSGPLKLTWKGVGLDAMLWAQIVAFFRWTYAEHKAEATVRLYYNEVHHAWRVVVLPQQICGGLHVEELPGHPDRSQILADIDLLEWKDAGSVHHHCGCSAFQSGGDRDDEQNKSGLHLTVGKVDQAVVDIHARAVYRGIMYEVELTEWFDFGLDFLHEPVAVAFPEEWKARMIPTPPRPVLPVERPNYDAPYALRGFAWAEDDWQEDETRTNWSAIDPEGNCGSYMDEAQAALDRFEEFLCACPKLSQMFAAPSADCDKVFDFLRAYVALSNSLSEVSGAPSTLSELVFELVGAEREEAYLLTEDAIDDIEYGLQLRQRVSESA